MHLGVSRWVLGLHVSNCLHGQTTEDISLKVFMRHVIACEWLREVNRFLIEKLSYSKLNLEVEFGVDNIRR
ncbi:hypothetical protein VNO77_10074 [Canavalia gladiata]|uniref:Uncharacterized protein n=1 Tax=Canavalia gladiata TaxID=3824 RepID=A0AAN9QXD1_CANGL